MTQQKCWHVAHKRTHASPSTATALLIYDLLTYDTRLLIAATRDNIAVAAAYALTIDTQHILPAYVHTLHT